MNLPIFSSVTYSLEPKVLRSFSIETYQNTERPCSVPSFLHELDCDIYIPTQTTSIPQIVGPSEKEKIEVLTCDFIRLNDYFGNLTLLFIHNPKLKEM